MASPVDAARTGTNIATAADPWATVGLPASSAGELLILLTRTGAAQTTNTPTGWTALVANNVADATDDATSIFYRWTDGSEGTTLSVDQSASAKGATICWRVTGAINPATQPPEVSTAVTHTTVANTANPGSVTPTGGSKDYLFLAMGAQGGEVGAFTGAPTNYVNLVTANSGTGGTAPTNCMMGGASRQLTAASEDPGVFTHGAADLGGVAFTVAIHPAPPVIPEIPNLAVARATSPLNPLGTW